MADQEVILNILDLLETMEEGLDYIKGKLTELDIEASMPVLADIIAAFSSVEKSLDPMIDELEDNKILEKTEELKKQLDLMVNEYEKETGGEFQEVMSSHLEPAFANWKEEIELRIRPYVVS